MSIEYTSDKELEHLAKEIADRPLVALHADAGSEEFCKPPRFLFIGVSGRHVARVDLRMPTSVGGVSAALQKVAVIVHDGTWMLAQLEHHFGIRPTTVFDTRLAAKLLDADRDTTREFGLDECILTELGLTLPKRSWAPGTAPDVASPEAAAAVLSLWPALERKLIEADLAEVAMLEFDLVTVVAAMIAAGLGLNRERWAAMFDAARRQMVELRRRLEQSLGTPTLHNAEILAALQKRGFGIIATDKDALAPHAHDPVIRDVIAFHSTEAFVRGVGATMLAAVDRSHDGRVRAHLDQLGTATGRFTSHLPNFLGLSRDPAVRGCIEPPPDWLFVCGDYRHSQLRIAAACAGENALIALFRRGGDPHRLTASILLGIAESEVSDDAVASAKAVNFGFLFGMGVDAFIAYAWSDYGVLLTKQEASALKAKFFNSYPEFAAWHAETAEEEFAGLASALGRVRYFDPGDFCARLASPIQGTEADGLKLAMVRLAPILRQYGAQILLCLHDELLIQTPRKFAVEVACHVERVMRESMQELVPDVPIAVDVSIRETWSKTSKLASPVSAQFPTEH